MLCFFNYVLKLVMVKTAGILTWKAARARAAWTIVQISRWKVIGSTRALGFVFGIFRIPGRKSAMNEHFLLQSVQAMLLFLRFESHDLPAQCENSVARFYFKIVISVASRRHAGFRNQNYF